ncbi:integrase [Actinocrispum wychmicini]|uniref:Phage integrase family protein n=1 Tax=Actinocrispum wychmicini TaxID=1213861 RepID=A0A4R2J8R2_9PSEU|nr:integrase [Actinocrispum wychmicini]TCO55693.1 phage integrase family protein [Actinocrispum wychmicini]
MKRDPGHVGEYAPERLVASPVQGLRAAMRLYESGLGLGGFTLCLLDLYTGGRWSELAGQQKHEYDQLHRAIGIRAPLKEVGGVLTKYGRPVTEVAAIAPPPRQRQQGAAARKGRTKTPAGTRWVQLPPSIAVFYEQLMDSHNHPFVFTTPEGHPWRRSNFRNRYWRPAWDGVSADSPNATDHLPAVLPWFTFHEGRHTHATWLTEDGVPEVARRARLGQKMKGIARVYDHVTDAMRHQVNDALEARWTAGLLALTATERARLTDWFPHLGPVITKLMIEYRDGKEELIPISSPFDH